MAESRLRHFQEGLGETGHFGEFIAGLGLLIALGGLGMILSSLWGFWYGIQDGSEPGYDAVPAGLLFVIMGLGFTVFGAMVMRAGWARHHPGYEESR